MPEVRLNASDAAELAELQQFLSGWLARDLAASLADCAGNPGLRHHAAAAGPGPFHLPARRRRRRRGTARPAPP
jgi:hypothetical protein